MTIQTTRTPQRPTTWHLTAICAVGVLLLTGCAGVSEPQLVEGDGAAWSIGVAEPRFAGDERCDSDPMIDTAVMTADMPSSGYGITLVAEATEEDAQRVADCLRDALTSGTITISSPSGE